MMWLKKPMKKAGLYTAFTINGGIPKSAWNWKVLGKGIRKVNTREYWDAYMLKESTWNIDSRPTDDDYRMEIEEYAAEPTKRPQLNERNDLKSWDEGDEKLWFQKERDTIMAQEQCPKMREHRLRFNEEMEERAKVAHITARALGREEAAERQRKCRAEKRKREEEEGSEKPKIPWRANDRCWNCGMLGHWKHECTYEKGIFDDL